MEVLRNGKFSFSIKTADLARGLRPSKRSPRNKRYLTDCSGAVGRDNVLQILDELTRLDTSTITDSFPYPQIFIFTNHIIICGQTKIYEWVGGALVEKLTVTAGSTWSAVDFYDYIYLSNSKVAVVRDSQGGGYSLSTLPKASAICNFNGQVIIGAPDEEV